VVVVPKKRAWVYKDRPQAWTKNTENGFHQLVQIFGFLNVHFRLFITRSGWDYVRSELMSHLPEHLQAVSLLLVPLLPEPGISLESLRTLSYLRESDFVGDALLHLFDLRANFGHFYVI